jgi:hypothetical protein
MKLEVPRYAATGVFGAILMCLSGCDDDNARFLTQTTTTITTTITTTTTTAMSPGRFELRVASLINYKDGEEEFPPPSCSVFQTLVPGESVNLSEHSGNPSDCFTEAQCRGVCGSLTLTGTFDDSQFGMIARPFDSALCPDEEITITSGSDKRWSLKRENITCTTPTPFTPNVWDPETNSVIEMTFCSDMNPRLRCNNATSRCWYVPETRVCPSGPDQCASDPTCTCGEGMVKTTVLSSTHASNNSALTFDIGAWCWRCEPRTQLSCEDPLLSQDAAWHSYPKTCASESSCICPESDSWVRPVIKRAFYTDANRTELVPKSTPGALKCFTCEKNPFSYSVKEIMEIETTLYVFVLPGQ